MKVLQSESQNEFFSAIRGIRGRLPEWALAAISFTAAGKGNIQEVATDLRDSLGDREGTIFIYNQRYLLAMLEMKTKTECLELFNIMQETVRKHGCSLKYENVTNNSLGWLNVAAKSEKTRTPTVMVIDDDLIVRDLMSCAMEDHGKVIELEDSSNVAETYLKTKPDVVFLDINMPGRSGWDVLEEIRRIDPDANVVMLSGSSTPDNVAQARKRGAKSFIGKPFAMGTIREKLRNCTATRIQ